MTAGIFTRLTPSAENPPIADGFGRYDLRADLVAPPPDEMLPEAALLTLEAVNCGRLAPSTPPIMRNLSALAARARVVWLQSDDRVVRDEITDDQRLIDEAMRAGGFRGRRPTVSRVCPDYLPAHLLKAAARDDMPAPARERLRVFVMAMK